MESTRWLRLAPLALAVATGAIGIGRPIADAAADPPWDPPPCAPGEAADLPAAAAWYRLDPVLDRQGALASMRLTVGTAGGSGRWLPLSPESFASGPAAGVVLTGTDDGTASHLRLLDPGRGCASALADEASVIRSAVLAADGSAVLEHRVDRVTRADLGIWRRPVAAGGTAAGGPVRVLPGLEADAAHGRTFTTELLVADDGRIVVSSCGIEACRDRVLDAAGGIATVEAVGPALGVEESRLIARDVCAGDPCGILAVDLATGAREVLVEAAAAGARGGGIRGYGVGGGRVAGRDIATGRRSGPSDEGGIPIRGGSLALAGAGTPEGTVALAPGGRPTSANLRGLDPRSLASTTVVEERR